MTWIETVDYDNAPAELKAFYSKDYQANGFLQNIFQALSLRPESLITLAEFRKTFAGDNSLLGRRKEELIHTTVSTLNNSRHCLNSHSEKLRLIAPQIADQVKEDWRLADLTADEQVMLEFCEKAILHRTDVTPADINLLRAAGFCDNEILEIVLHIAYRYFMNIIADVLGVEDEPVIAAG